MKCLITGATGFLGKRITKLLLEDPNIEEIHIVSRRNLSSPHPKIQVHVADLAEPSATDQCLKGIDTLIHLAGLYDFRSSLSENYQQNVLMNLNLIEKLRELPSPPQIIIASTYAVGMRTGKALSEQPLSVLPPPQIPYAYSKALAERAWTDSELACRIFRIGVLVGDTLEGNIEKIDGPYYFMKFFHQLSKYSFSKYLYRMPMPVRKSGILPIVPVDIAAKAFHEALTLPPVPTGKVEIFGLYNSKSVQLGYLSRVTLRHFLKECEPAFMLPQISALWSRIQPKLSGIPHEVFHYALDPIKLKNSHYESVFKNNPVPAFETYEDAYLKGFTKCFAGEP